MEEIVIIKGILSVMDMVAAMAEAQGTQLTDEFVASRTAFRREIARQAQALATGGDDS